MEILNTLLPVATFIIAFCSLFAGLGFVFNLLLGPITASQEQLKANQVRIEKELGEFKTEVNNKFKEINSKFKEVNTKLDKLLNK